MNSRIVVDGKELKLNRFITELTGNVLEALARSLKFAGGKRIEFRLSGEDVAMFVDENEVPLNYGSASRIVRDVLKGLTGNLYGTESAKEVRMIYEQDPSVQEPQSGGESWH